MKEGSLINGEDDSYEEEGDESMFIVYRYKSWLAKAGFAEGLLLSEKVGLDPSVVVEAPKKMKLTGKDGSSGY
ncbi:hypothetical protein L1987_18637 [Smallanthus sonchifolius]|uniref:Uncharacterized protein n=1 Tax=Smallanthus sonchifolius TaxID=185202 RepID=A0ACB9J1C7_9ASTR|nr:hypothetical protein L1987_18637 [Smallanthus sonchifolius]